MRQHWSQIRQVKLSGLAGKTKSGKRPIKVKMGCRLGKV
jgi:hypothetical protein